MKRIVALVAAAGILGLLWCLLRPATRHMAAQVAPPIDLQAYEPASQVRLVEQRPLASIGEPEGGVLREAQPESHRSAIAPRRREAPAKAQVHGCLLVAESGDPIRDVLSIRLRTLDLEHKEDLFTRNDGSFTSAKRYLPGVLLAQVKDREGRELADHEAAFDPSSAEPWAVPIVYDEYPTFVRGRVVDLQDSPLDKVSVRIVPLESPPSSSDLRGAVYEDGGWFVTSSRLGELHEWSDERMTNEDGCFELNVLRGGKHRLHLQGLWRNESRELLLHTGPNELGNLVLNEPRSEGLLVRFVCDVERVEGIPCQGRGSRPGPEALIAVQPATLPGELVLYSFPTEAQAPRWELCAKEQGSGTFELRVPRLPSGACTVKVEGLDGRAYDPGLAVVDVPGTLEVRVSGKQHWKHLRALEAETGKPITRFQAWMRCHGAWRLRQSNDQGRLFLCGEDAWVVLSERHRGVRGTDAPDEDGIIEVPLESGSWSALLVFEESAGETPDKLDFGRKRRLLAGVEVLADGRSVGTSDDEGMLLLASDSAPRELAFRLESWHVVEESDPGAVPRSGSVHQVWMRPDG